MEEDGNGNCTMCRVGFYKGKMQLHKSGTLNLFLSAELNINDKTNTMYENLCSYQKLNNNPIRGEKSFAATNRIHLFEFFRNSG